MAGVGITCSSRTKRFSEDAVLDEFPDPTELTADQLRLQFETISGYRDQLHTQLGNAKSEKKDLLRKAINGICNAYLTLSSAYMYKLGQEKATDLGKSSPTYANVIKQKPAITANRVTLDRGNPIPISGCTRVMVGAKGDASDRFTSARQTKDTFVNSLDPVQLKIKTKRIHYTVNNAIVIEADDIDVNALRNCSALSDAGLEVKEDVKLNPRIIVHDIPVDYTEQEIHKSFLELNLPQFTPDDVKVVSL